MGRAVGRGRPDRARSSIGLVVLVVDGDEFSWVAFEHLRARLDGWTVVDARTDGAPVAVGRDWASLPGAVHRRAWRDWAWNRNEALALGADLAMYSLVLDTGEVLHGDLPDQLWSDAYSVRVARRGRWTPRLLRNDLPFRYVGAVDERLSCAVDHVLDRLPGTWIEAQDERLRPARHPERNRQLAVAATRAHPEDLWAEFSLGMAELELGDADAARPLLEACAANPSWPELAFLAGHELARIDAAADPELGMRRLTELWETRPWRAEPLHALAVLANANGRPTAALMATSVAVDLPVSDDEFVDPIVSRWAVRLEHAATLAALGRLAEANEVVDRVLADAEAPDELVVDGLLMRQSIVDGPGGAWSRVSQPDEVSAQRLGRPPIFTGVVGATVSVDLSLPVGEPWELVSVALSGHDGGFALHLVGEDRNAPGRRRFLRVHDAGGSPTSLAELGDPVDDVGPVAGWRAHPARIVWWDDAWHVVEPLRDDPGSPGLLTALREQGSRREELPVAGSGGASAGWMPLATEGALVVVTGLHPFVVSAWDPEERRWCTLRQMSGPACLRGWEGSSSGVLTEDGPVFVVRRVRHGERGALVTHRVLALDHTYRPVGLSDEFVFRRYGNEVCLGLAEWGGDLLFACADQGRGWLTSASFAAVTRSLEPV